jgi:hypothetical protein
LRWFEVKLQRFLQVGEGLFFGLALAGDVDLEALRNVPVPFAPNCSGKRSFHEHILAQKDGDSLDYFCTRVTCPLSTTALSMRSGSLNVLVMPTFGYFGVRKC